MRAVRALQRRLARLEKAGKPRPSPFVIAFGSFDAFVAVIVDEVCIGKLDWRDMIDVIAALRNWEEDGTWARAVER